PVRVKKHGGLKTPRAPTPLTAAKTQPPPPVAHARGQTWGNSGESSGSPSRWVGDDASFADRGGVTSPPFPELTLRDGDPLDSPLFPQVWPRA
ncbi:hypothetical protein PT211_20710, partial [Klebsiella pneumoniae]|nr:hypothetical protein [Klebsiella pneumoniae]